MLYYSRFFRYVRTYDSYVKMYDLLSSYWFNHFEKCAKHFFILPYPIPVLRRYCNVLIFSIVCFEKNQKKSKKSGSFQFQSKSFLENLFFLHYFVSDFKTTVQLYGM